MRKSRILALLLSMMLFVCTFSAPVIVRGIDVSLTLESILGYDAIASTVTFDENFESGATGYVAQAVDLATRDALGTTALCEGFVIDDSSGEMALRVVNPTIDGKSPAFGWGIGASRQWNPLSASGAIRFRAKLTEGASLGVRINRTRTDIVISENKISMLGGSNGNKNIGVHPGTAWNTYLVTSDGTGYSLYIQPDGGEWSHVHTCDGFKDSKGDWGVVFSVGAEQIAYLDYVEVLSKDDRILLGERLWERTVENGGMIDYDKEADAVTFSCDVPYSQGGQLGIHTPLVVNNDAFDISWTMKAESYSGRESVIIYTGRYRLYLVFSKGAVNLQGIGRTGYPLTLDDTRIRVVGKEGVAALYINDALIVTNIPMRSSSASAGIEIGTYGGNNGEFSHFTIKDMVICEVDNSLVLPEGPQPQEERIEFDTQNLQLNLDETWTLDTSGSGTISSKNSQYFSKRYATVPLWFADEFDLEFRMRFLEYGDFASINLFWPGGAFQLDMREQFFHTEKESSDNLPIGFLGNEYHIIKLESYADKSRVRVFVDEKMIGDFQTETGDEVVYSRIALCTYGTGTDASWIECDWIHHTPVWNAVKINSPIHGATYQMGSTIQLSATRRDGGNIGKINYYLNGAKAASNSFLGFTFLSNLPVGNYTLVAEADGVTGQGIEFSVVPNGMGSLNLRLDKEGEAVATVVPMDGTTEVEFLLDGISLGSETTPFKKSISYEPSYGHSVVVVCRNEAGVVLEKLSEKIEPTPSWEVSTKHYSNEVSYTLKGASGTASMKLANGNHLLSLTHRTEKLTFLTDEGEKSVIAGIGEYHILTDGPFADVYHGGKHLVSFLMPRSDSVKNSFAENGLRIKDYKVKVPEGRTNYFYRENVTDQNKVYDLTGLEGDYNLDFIANDKDAFHLVVNDGVFRGDLTVENGKIYVETANNSKSEPYTMELADMPTREVYYRLAMSGGMATLYGDGHFLGSFRAIHAVGDARIGISIYTGSLGTIAVNEYTDLYLYEELFADTGENATEDYWHLTGMNRSIDPIRRRMTLDAKAQENAIAELYASAGNLTMEAEVTIENCKGGFGFLLNHCTTETYTRAWYNARLGCFEIIDRKESDDASSVDAVTSEAVVLPTNEKILLKATAEEHPEGKIIVLYVNGEEVLRKENSFDHRGKVGFILSDAVAQVTSFTYRGDTKPVLDVREAILPATTLDMIEGKDGTLYMVNTSGGYLTRDGGKTWETTLDTWMMSPNMLRLSTGEILSYDRKKVGTTIYGRPIFEHRIGISDDDGATWKEQGLLEKEPQEGYGNTIHRLTEGPALEGKDYGRIYFIGYFNEINENYGSSQVYYSDDKGKTWNKGFVFTYENLGNTNMQEPIIIETTEWTRCYYRNDKGMIRYLESPDRGITWNPKESYSTPFFMSMNCFGMDVQRSKDVVTGDIKEELYLSWSADNQNLHPRFQYPRTNWRVARSLDCGKNWEFYGTLHENNSYITNQMNQGVNVSSEYIIVNSYTTDVAGTSEGKNGRIGLLPREKQTTTLRPDRLHTLYPEQLAEVAAIRQNRVNRALVVNEITGMALLRGNGVEGVVKSNAISVSCAASYLGAEVSQTGSQVSLKIGDSVESFECREDGFIVLTEFVERYGLYLHSLRDGDVKVISPYSSWTQREQDALYYSVVFS